MTCPTCNNTETRVVDSRHTSTGIRRRRECESCDYRFTTYELTGRPAARVTTEYAGWPPRERDRPRHDHGEPLSTLPAKTGEYGFRERKSSEDRGSGTYALRVCPVCGGSFKPSTANQVYCPPTELDRARAKNSQPRSRCAKRADNAKQRGWDPASRPLLEPFDCGWCSKPCVPGENVPPHATRFCCRHHKALWHRASAKAAT